MSIAIEKAAKGYAEKITRESGQIAVIQCPAVDWAVRKFAADLVKNGLIDPDKMFEFLDDRKYRDDTPETWWL